MNQELYDSQAASRSLWASLAEVVRFRDLLAMLVKLSLTVRYKRSLLGVGWTLLNPLLHMAVLSVAFSTLFASHVPRYPVYVFTGLIVMDFFSQTTSFAVNQLAWGSPLLSRVWLPAAVFPISAVGSGVVNFLITLLPLAAIMAAFGSPVSWHVVLFPLSLVALAMFSLGVGLILAALAIHFHDVVNMWGVILRAWYFLTPVMYPEEIFPKNARWLLEVNPLHHILLCFREPVLAGKFPSMEHLVASFAWGFGALAFGWWYFSRRRFEFALLG